MEVLLQNSSLQKWSVAPEYGDVGPATQAFLGAEALARHG